MLPYVSHKAKGFTKRLKTHVKQLLPASIVQHRVKIKLSANDATPHTQPQLTAEPAIQEQYQDFN